MSLDSALEGVPVIKELGTRDSKEKDSILCIYTSESDICRCQPYQLPVKELSALLEELSTRREQSMMVQFYDYVQI